MSEEIEKNSVPPVEKPAAPKPAPKPASKKPAGNPFLGKNNNFTSSKAGNPGNRGKAFKGGGVKKGK